MQTILVEFLKAGLLPIGEDDEKLKLLEAASDDLAKEIKAQPLLAYRLALVGLDQRVSATDPVHQMAGAAIQKRWQTIFNKVGAGPVQVHRAVILRAIQIAADDNARMQAAMTFVARNQPSEARDDKCGDAISAMFVEFEKAVAAEIPQIWINSVDLSLPKLSPKAKKSQVNKEELALSLSRAAGPTDKSGKALPTPNPHWPNEGQPWSIAFVDRATDAIAAAIQSGAKAHADEIQDAFREGFQGLVSGIEQLVVRDAKTELLWIRASLYSSSAHAGLRALEQHQMIFHAALDVSRIVHAIAPPSVEYFLRDLVAEVSTKKAMRLSKLLGSIGDGLLAQPEGIAISKDLLPANGRRSWLDIAVRSDAQSSFEDKSGVVETYEDSPGELAVKLYRELQIRKLLAATP